MLKSYPVEFGRIVILVDLFDVRYILSIKCDELFTVRSHLSYKYVTIV